jgi:hypothetical protein
MKKLIYVFLLSVLLFGCEKSNPITPEQKVITAECFDCLPWVILPDTLLTKGAM